MSILIGILRIELALNSLVFWAFRTID